MLKLVFLIVRLRYSYKKKIKTDYEVQFPTNSILNDKIKQNQLNKRHKKQHESTRLNPLSTVLGS